MVLILCFMYSQGSRRSCARQPFDWCRTATRGSGCMGRSGRGHNAPRWCHWLFLPDEHLHLVARINHGARRRRVYLFGDTRSSRRNVEARQKARYYELCVRGRSHRGSQYCTAIAWVADASRVLASASSRTRIFLKVHTTNAALFIKSLLRRDAETNTRDACATQKTRD